MFKSTKPLVFLFALTLVNCTSVSAAKVYNQNYGTISTNDTRFKNEALACVEDYNNNVSTYAEDALIGAGDTLKRIDEESLGNLLIAFGVFNKSSSVIGYVSRCLTVKGWSKAE